MKKIVLVVLVALVGFVAQAQEKKNKNAKHVTEVNGNCGMCQKRIQKAALSVEGVKSAVWDVDSHQLTLILNEEKCAPLDIKKAVAKVGHDTDEVKATKEDYDKLHTCCMYDRKQ
jgi:mercuric ion binding protein